MAERNAVGQGQIWVAHDCTYTKAELRQQHCRRYSIWELMSGHDRRVTKEEGKPVQRYAIQSVAALE